MNNSVQVRRATLDDLGRLRNIWVKAKLDCAALEKRFTEFQVIEREGIAACIGIKIANQQGLIHSEAIADFTQRGQLAPALWERIQVVARNHGLHWLWMDEPEPSWIQIGFGPANPEQLRKLPANFGTSKRWHALQLKADNEATLSLEQELELFRQAQKKSRDDRLRQARGFKYFAYGLLCLVVAGLVALLIITPRRRPGERNGLSNLHTKARTNTSTLTGSR